MDIKNYVENHYYLLLTALFVSVIVSVKLYVQLSVGPGWDTYSFSLNALEYAGIGTGYYELDRGLFVPFLASLLFRTGIVSIYVMMFLDSLFALLGGIFLYLLITLKTEKIVGMLSSLIYITSFIMLEWIGVGYTDIASVTLSIMALYFWVRGNDERPILIPLSWILLMLAFLTRTTAALIIVPMVFYYVSTQKRITFVWQHLVGIAGALGVSLPSLIFYANRTGNPLFYFNMVLSGFGRSTESTGATGEIYSQSKYFFIDNIGKALLVDKIQFLAFFFVVVSSCTVILLYIFRSRKRVMSFWLFIAFSIFILVLFEYSSFMVVEMASFLSLYALYRYTNPRFEGNKGAFYLMLAMWGLSYFFFHSSYFQKVSRYYLTMVPAISFLVAMGMFKLGVVFGNFTNRRKVISVAVTTFMVISFFGSSISYTSELQEQEPSSVITYSKTMASWIDENIDDYDSSLVYSELWVILGWYTRHEVFSMPFFYEQEYFDHELQKYGVDYYATRNFSTFPSCEELHRIAGFRLLHRIGREEKPEGFYIGRSWENYFEAMLDYDVYLFHGEKHIRDASQYIDDYSLEDLKKYDFLALYNFKWRNFSRAEELLKAYISQGGVVVIDCSNNFNDPVYSLDNQEILGSLVRRDSVNPNAEPTLFNMGPYAFSPFSDNGTLWYGATYLPDNGGGESYAVYATLDGSILASIEHMGEGSIIWLGYNLIFHAFDNMNEEEQSFLHDLFEQEIIS